MGYHLRTNITIGLSEPITEEVQLTGNIDNGNAALTAARAVLSPTAPVAFFEVQHVQPGAARLSVVAQGESSNYHYAEVHVDISLNYPGFDVSTLLIHVQRWRGNVLSGDAVGNDPGYNDVFVSPNEEPDSETVLTVVNSDTEVTDLRAKDWVEAMVKTSALQRFVRFFPGEGFPVSKYVRAYHKGVVGTAGMTLDGPDAKRWPLVSGCCPQGLSCRDTCAGWSEAVYYGQVMPIPRVTIVTHAGFTAPVTTVFIQRLSYNTFQMNLDQLNTHDVTVYFTSSDTDIATVQDFVFFNAEENTPKTVTVFNVNPGTARISFRAESAGLDFGGALAKDAILLNCQQGFGLSSLLVHVPPSTTNGGYAQLRIVPDIAPSHDVTMHIASSDTSQVTANASVLFEAGTVSMQTVYLRHNASGRASDDVKLTLTLSTHIEGNYNNVLVPQISVIALGEIVPSVSRTRVQKGRTTTFLISPNVVPDDNVVITITVSNSSVITATESVTFLASKLDGSEVTVTHVSTGTATLSFFASSPAGNYMGSQLVNGVTVDAVVGFTVFSRVTGVAEDIPDEQIAEADLLIVQQQPTSHLGVASFLVAPDVPVTAVTYVEVKVTDGEILSSTSNVTFAPNDAQRFKLVHVFHGGKPGLASVYFRALTEDLSGNYHSIESGNVRIRTLPGFLFSQTLVDVQTDGIGTFTLRPDLAPTEDVTVTMVSSDPSVASVTPSVILRSADGTTPANTKTVTISYVQQGTVAISFFAVGGNYDGVIWSNGVVAASRPGFVISASSIAVPYNGEVSFTVTPDTVPTTDATVTVTSSQPAKAAPVEAIFVLRAGEIATETVRVRSWCSVAPGNCARSGVARLAFSVSAPGGNYDGVATGEVVTARALAPEISVSAAALYVQAQPGTATFAVEPPPPPPPPPPTTAPTRVPAVRSLTFFQAGRANRRALDRNDRALCRSRQPSAGSPAERLLRRGGAGRRARRGAARDRRAPWGRRHARPDRGAGPGRVQLRQDRRQDTLRARPRALRGRARDRAAAGDPPPPPLPY